MTDDALSALAREIGKWAQTVQVAGLPHTSDHALGEIEAILRKPEAIAQQAEEIDRLKANRDAERHRADAFEREVASLRAELEQARSNLDESSEQLRRYAVNLEIAERALEQTRQAIQVISNLATGWRGAIPADEYEALAKVIREEGSTP